MTNFRFKITVAIAFQPVLGGWPYLACQFDPDWIDGDEDEGQVKRMMDWLVENGIWHHLSYEDELDERGNGPSSTITRFTFYVHLYDPRAAFFFRLHHPIAYDRQQETPHVA
jgi:hypothetical protein